MLPPAATADSRREERWRVAWIVLLAIAAALRLWDLGARVMSHDESLHAFYSLELFSRGTYRHDPVYHGPLMYHVNAVVYYLFGVSDTTARLAPALLGVALVAMARLFARWIGQPAAFVAAVLVAFSPTLVFYSRYIREDVYAATCTLAWVYAALRYSEARERRWLYLLTASMALSFIAKETSFMSGAVIGSFFALRAVMPIHDEDALRERMAARDLAVLMLTLVLPFASGVGYFAFGWNPAVPAFSFTSHTGGAAMVGGLCVVAIGMGLSYFRSTNDSEPGATRDTWLRLAILFWAVQILFFTGFFTNVRGGLQSGIVGSLGYWLTQHEVARASQPWFFYFVVAGLYELLTLIAATAAIAVIARRHRGALWMALTAWWAVGSWLLFGWAGERMPWLLVHQILPLCLLAGWWLEPLLTSTWRSPERAKVIGIALLTMVAVIAAVNVLRTPPFTGRNLTATALTAAWWIRLLLLVGTMTLMWRIARAVGRRDLARAAGCAAAVLLAVLIVRGMLRLTFVNYDSAAEVMSYAQASSDVKRALRELAVVSERTVGEHGLEIAFDDESTWPLLWYLRDYPKARTWGDNPEFIANAPVVLVGPKNKARVAAHLRDYAGVQYILYWWPIQDYARLTPGVIWNALSDPGTRQYLWRVYFHRDYGFDPRQWPSRREFELWIRTDLAAAASTSTPFALGAFSRGDSAIGLSEAQWAPRNVLSGPFDGKPLRAPTSIAVAPDGSRVVADSGNSRVVVIARDGTFRRAIGSVRCNLAEPSPTGCSDSDGVGPLRIGDTQFSEPWGVALNQSGELFVADTWNGRVLVFDAAGSFRRKWGRFGQPSSASEDIKQAWLYGPRGLAFDHLGRLVIADTGNKRVLVFSTTGVLSDRVVPTDLTPQSFDEPTAIVADPNQTLLVADAWNRRIVRFDRNGRSLAAWSVPGWTSREVVDKPMLAVDDRGFVYASDPAAGRIFVFTPAGAVAAVVRVPGVNGASRPTGLAVDHESKSLLVTDLDGARVLELPLFQGTR